MTDCPQPKPFHLEPSFLGTKKYWDNIYTVELSNNTQNPLDVGTIWFEDSAAEDKVLFFLQDPSLGLDRETCSFLDVGTGNGHFLFKLREGSDEEEEEGDEDYIGEGTEATTNMSDKPGGFRGRMLGEDYSHKSIEFAQRLGTLKGFGPGTPGYVEFQQRDIMRDSPYPDTLSKAQEHGWDVVLDKGTFDAISLSDENDEQGRRVCEGYKERIELLVKREGFFLVTSCNWSADELRSWFEGGSFTYHGAVKYPSFSFGGREGQTISSVCFRKRRS